MVSDMGHGELTAHHRPTKSSAPVGHALVIGGSIGGLFAASLLRQTGWKVTVFERSRDGLASRGAGIGISEELVTIMRYIGAHLDMSSVVALNASIWLDQQGRVVFEHKRSWNATTWSRIYLPLRALIPDGDYHAGMTLARIEQDAGSVTAIFADGTRLSGDLLVAADGNQSTVRHQLMPEVQPRYAGYVAWRGIMEERDLPAVFRSAFVDKILFSFPEGEMAACMPVPGAGDDMRPGHRRRYFVWYRPTTLEALAELCTDASGHCHGTSIPPPLIRPEFLSEIRNRATNIFAPDLATIVDQTEQPLLQAISDLDAPRLTLGRVALLGDAASIARPHVVAGTTKAAINARCLVDSLIEADGNIHAALDRYDCEQSAFGSKFVAHGRFLGAYLEGQLKPVAERSGDELHRDPTRLLREMGASHLVRDFHPRGLKASKR